MTATELAEPAVKITRIEMAKSKEDELNTLDAFIDAFDSEITGWKMRVRELEGDGED